METNKALDTEARQMPLGAWNDVAEYRTVADGQSIEVADRLAHHLVSAVDQSIRVLFPATTRLDWQAFVLEMKQRAELISPQEIRRCVIDGIHEAGSELQEETKTINASQRRYNEALLRSKPHDKALPIDLPDKPEEWTVAVREFEELPLEKWGEIRQEFLRLLDHAGHIDLAAIEREIADVLAFTVWSLQGRILSRGEDRSRWIRPENEAIVQFTEAQHRWRQDIETPLRMLWKMGVRSPYMWALWSGIGRLMGIEREDTDSKNFDNFMSHLWETLYDYTRKRPLHRMLDDGAEGKLLNSIKVSVRHDLYDTARYDCAKKRGGKVDVVMASDLIEQTIARGSRGEPSEDDVLTEADLGYRGCLEEPTWGEMTLELTKAELARDWKLTPRQRDLVSILLKDEGLRDNEVAEQMGISKGRVSQLKSKIAEKLMERYPERLNK